MTFLEAALAFALLTVKPVGAQTPKVIGFICYPSDEMIKESCDEFKKQMKDCGVKVVALDDFSGDLTNPEEKKRAAELLGLPPTTPIFLSSHGSSFGGKHYIGSSLGDIDSATLGEHDRWEAPEIMQSAGAPQAAQVFATDRILGALGDRPKLLSACFAGRACETGKPNKNLIASCAADETSKQITVPGDGYQEPVLYWAGQLYCDPKTFAEADTTAPKGELSETEIAYFLAKQMGGKKTVPFVFTSKDMNVDPEELKTLREFVTVPRKTTEIRILDESKLKGAAESKAKELVSGKADLKSKAVPAGKLKEISWTVKGKTQTHLLPGYYDNEYTAKAAAKALLKARGVEVTDFKVSDVGSVFQIVVEDMKEPCRVSREGIPQSPRIEGTIRSLTH